MQPMLTSQLYLKSAASFLPDFFSSIILTSLIICDFMSFMFNNAVFATS